MDNLEPSLAPDRPPLWVGCAAGFSGDRTDAAAPVVRALAASGQSACLIFETLADRKSTRLNSSHLVISYAVFCLKKKNTLNPSYYHAPPIVREVTNEGMTDASAIHALAQNEERLDRPLIILRSLLTHSLYNSTYA